MNIFSIIEFCIYFIPIFVGALIGYMIIKQFYRINNFSIFLFVVVSLSISVFKAWRVNNPPDSRFIYLFENYTKTEFPEAAFIKEKKIFTALNDGWESAVIKVNDSIVFLQLKQDLRKKKFLRFICKDPKKSYFNSDIFLKQGEFDSIVKNDKERFTLVFVDDEKKIIFEKS